MKPLNILALTRNPRGYSIRRLRAAARERGHHLLTRDPLNFSIHIEQGTPDLSYRQRPFGHVDYVIPRIGASITGFGCSLVRQFEQMGVPVLSSAAAISQSRDKLRSMQIFSRHDIGIPPTAFVRRKQDVLSAIARVGGAPVIIKLLEGSQGVGVILADNVKIAEAIIETLQSARQNVLLQKFVAESKGRDIRAFVVGGRVVAAMRRLAKGQEFRSNIHRGGTGEPITLDETFERTAVKAAQIMGLKVAGVDMLEGRDGPQVMEVNSSPGLEGIEKATGIDIAGAIIDDILDQIQFPDIDLHQRLTMRAGYGVAEFVVDKESDLAHKTLLQTGLRDREVLIMTLERGSLVIPAPHGEQEILPGDKLTCFGKLTLLKSLVPAHPPKRKRKPGTQKRRVSGR